jgi:Tfp pilus assembly protein PilF
MPTSNLATYEFLNQMLQASERGDSTEAEKHLKQALELDPENMDALRHAAGFYHFVVRDPAKAQHYAKLCRIQALKVTVQMDEILGQDGSQQSDPERSQTSKRPASRHIGGIIGPY